MVWHSHLFKNFPQFIVIHIIKGFGIVNKAEIDVLLDFSCFFDNAADVGNLISGSSAFSTSNLNIWKFSVHVLVKHSLKDFEHNLTGMQNEHNYIVVCTFVGTAFWDWNEKFSKFAGILSVAVSQHHILGFEIAQLEFHYLH